MGRLRPDRTVKRSVSWNADHIGISPDAWEGCGENEFARSGPCLILRPECTEDLTVSRNDDHICLDSLLVKGRVYSNEARRFACACDSKLFTD